MPVTPNKQRPPAVSRRAGGFAVAILVLCMWALPAAADFLGTRVNRIFLDPGTAAALVDGLQAGDILSYILETTPDGASGSAAGHFAWMTAYIPAGVQVIGAEFARPVGDGTYVAIPAEPTDASYDGWGKRGPPTKPGYSPTTGTVRLGQGYINRLQQGVGIFYSSDPRTLVVPAGLGPLSPTGIKSGPQLAFNQFDFEQLQAFGIKGKDGNLSGNDGKGNTPLVSTDSGATWAGTGSPVAGPDTYYTNDYNPACSASTAFVDDVTCVGPWHRIAYFGSSIGHTDPVAPATAQGAIQNTSVPTGAGTVVSESSPLPDGSGGGPAVNAIRFLHGGRRLGKIENSRVTFKVTDPAAFSASCLNGSFALESNGGDTSDIAAKDNPWRYFEPQHVAFPCNFNGNLLKQARFVNGVASAGFALSAGDVVGYEITFTNLSGLTLTNVTLQDSPVANLALVEPGTPGCAYSSYDGDLPGPTYNAGSASSGGGTGPATWAAIPSLAPSAAVTVTMCAQVAGGAVLGDVVTNEAEVSYTLPDNSTETQTSDASGTIANRLEGTVYFDADQTGTPTSGDTGLGNILVELYVDVDGDGIYTPGVDTFFDSVTTLSDGSYSFTGLPVQDKKGNPLPPTDYLVVETDRSDLSSVADADTGVGSCGSGNGCNVIGALTVDPSTTALLANDFFDFGGGPTAALVGDFRTYPERGGIVVEWETSFEAGTAGFYLARWSSQTEEYTPVSDLLRAPPGATQGARYRYFDEGVTRGDHPLYAVIEVERSGATKVYGPWRPRLDETLDRAPMSEASEVTARRPSASARARRAAARRAASTRPTNLIELRRTSQSPRAKLFVTETGPYFVSDATIGSVLGRSSGEVRQLISTGGLKLSSRGRNVAWTAAPGGGGIEFYGEALDSPFAAENVYWLEARPGVRMQSARGRGVAGAAAGAGFPETRHFETDAFPATVVATNPKADYWYWNVVTAGDPQDGVKRFDVELPGVVGSGEASLKVRLRGATSAEARLDHEAVVRVNGVQVGRQRFAEFDEVTATFTFDGSLLVEGTNRLEVEGVALSGVPLSMFFIDSFDLSYRRRHAAAQGRLTFIGEGGEVTVSGFSAPDIVVWDVSTPRLPALVRGAAVEVDPAGGYRVRLEAGAGRRYLLAEEGQVFLPRRVEPAASAGLKGARGAEYVVITVPELRDGAESLARYRSRSGLTSMVVEVGDIFDEFNFGLPDPEALRDFLAYAYRNWPVRPRYVLLAGGGTFDYRNLLGVGDNLVPTLMVPTPFGLYASDTRLGDVRGRDGRPEIAVGRVPALSSEELEAYLDKLQSFEQSSRESWHSRVLMLADDPDSAGDFSSDSDAVAATLPGSVDVNKVYLSEAGSVDNARVHLFSALRDGVAVSNYLGHGGLDRLAGEGMLVTADVPNLGNAGRPTVLASLTCVVARFEVPGFDSLGMRLVLEPGAGAVAVWGPTGLSFNGGAKALDEAFLKQLFTGRSRRLGDAVLRALRDYRSTASPAFLADIYGILGDPAARVN